MLVLSRKRGEKVVVANAIEIEVLKIDKHSVRLGIKAPSHIAVFRYEVYERIKRNNAAETQSQIPDEETWEKMAKVLKARAGVDSRK